MFAEGRIAQGIGTAPPNFHRLFLYFQEVQQIKAATPLQAPKILYQKDGLDEPII